MSEQPPFKHVPQKGPDVTVTWREDGSIIITSNHPMAEGPRSIAHLLADRAIEIPDQDMLLQRAPNHGPWEGVTYGEAKRAADSIAQWLLDHGLGPDGVVMILSGNSVDHALVMLGCYTAGVPCAPVSIAYSLLSEDHAKLKHCFNVLHPKIVFAEKGAMFDRAVACLREIDPGIVYISSDGEGRDAIELAGLLETEPRNDVAEAMERLGADSIAKYLFTSGSTGTPKAVPQTHGMMSSLIAAQEGLREKQEGEEDVEPSIFLEWMPWSHISAGNISFNGNLWAGGTFYIDEGRPVPGMFETTIRNLYEVSPTVFGSAPVAFAMLAHAMETDEALRKSFFKNLKVMGYGGATLPDDLYERLQALAIAETGERFPIGTMYGATETQGVTVVHWATERVGLIGLPLPGISLKLVPNGDKMEVRVKGPTVMSGYHGDAERTAAAFDEEGYYKLGDAARFVDPDDPSKGLIFDGRVAEDFKLTSGTWVSVGILRPDIVAACSPYVADAVILGQDRPFVAVMLWPSRAALQSLGFDVDPGAALEAVSLLIKERLEAFNAHAGGSSRRVGRFTLLTDLPSLDAGEITDKGYINQRAAARHRAAIVEDLYAETPPLHIIQLG